MSINHCLFLVPAILSLHLNAPESLCVSLSCMYPCIGLVFSQVPTPTLLGDRNIGPPSSPDVRIVRERCSDSRIPGPGDRVEPHCRSLSLSLWLGSVCSLPPIVPLILVQGFISYVGTNTPWMSIQSPRTSQLVRLSPSGGALYLSWQTGHFVYAKPPVDGTALMTLVGAETVNRS
jgi:hypothetical protein